MTEIISIQTEQTMSSLQIAELTGKKHTHVMRDIRSILEQGVSESNFGLVEYIDAKGGKRPCYQLTKTGCLILASGYNALLREKIINPIIEWSEQDVWEFLNNVVEVPHCELYDQGWTRIGCILCPMASVKHAPRDIERWPHVKERWIRAIMDVRKESILANTPPHQNQSINSSLSTDCTPPHKQTLEGRNRQRTGEPVRIPPRFPIWGTQYDRMGTARRRNERDVQQLQERLLEGTSKQRQWRSLGCCRRIR